jgi:glycosyltransferase involved in cell wall biosynthesis
VRIVCPVRLLDAPLDVRRSLAAGAEHDGIDVFCYSLDDPGLSQMLADGAPSTPFVVVASPERDRSRLDVCLADPRYLRHEGRPMVLVRPARKPAWSASDLHLVGVLDEQPVRELEAFDACCELLPPWATSLDPNAFPAWASLADAASPLHPEPPYGCLSAEDGCLRAFHAPAVHPVQYRGVFADSRRDPSNGSRVVAPLMPDGLRHLVAAHASTFPPMPFLFAPWERGPWRAALAEGRAAGGAESAQARWLPCSPAPTDVPAELFLITRVALPVVRDVQWETLAAGMALDPKVGVVDCDPAHSRLADLMRVSNVVVLDLVDEALIDLVYGRLQQGLPTVLGRGAALQASGSAARAQARIQEDLRDLLRPRMAATHRECDEDAILLDQTDAATLLGLYRRISPAACRTAPLALPCLAGRRYGLWRGELEMTLQRAKGPDEIEPVIRARPRYIEAWRKRLRLLNDRGDSEAVVREAQVILDRAPHHARLRAELGRALFRLDRREEAFAQLLWAVRDNPGQVSAWSYLLRLAAMVRHPQGAELARQVVALHPRNYPLGILAAALVPNRDAFLVEVLERTVRDMEPVEMRDVERAFEDSLDPAGPHARSYLGRACRLLPGSAVLASRAARAGRRPEGASPSAPREGHSEEASPSAAREVGVLAEAALPFGVNLFGALRSITGLGQGARITARTLEAAGVPVALDNWTGEWTAGLEKGLTTEDGAHPYAINLIHANADEIISLTGRRGEGFLRGRYNIGYWNWELTTFPPSWSGAFRLLDEIWVPSEFTRRSLASISTLPVHCLPYAIEGEVERAPHLSRRLLGMADDVFCFLTAFDMYSVMERKNPIGAVRAFRRAFGSRPDVCLVVKCLHVEFDPQRFRRLRDEIGDARNIRVLLSPLSRREMNALVDMCDALVSLHRSEGYGLPLLEAMGAGKPVIATRYSGNVDFMNDANSVLIDFAEVAIGENFGPYPEGAVWAEPDGEQAADALRSLADDPARARTLGEQARRDVLKERSVSAIAQRMRARLDLIADRLGLEGRPKSQ